MGLSKSKQPKPIQPGMPTQPGFTAQTQVQTQQMPVQTSYAQQTYAPQQSYLVQPSYQTQPMQQSIYQTGYSTAHATYPTVAGAQQSVATAYPGSVYSSQTTYPVSYTNQQYRPLIPGYAPAPPQPAHVDRRQSVMPQEQQEKAEYSSRYYGEQSINQQPQSQQQMPQTMHTAKPRKH